MAEPATNTKLTTNAGAGAAKTTRANPDSLSVFNAIKFVPDFQNARVECMDGHEAEQSINGTASYSRSPNASVGEVCRLIMEHSADVQRNPTALKANPDQGLLAPYAAIAADKRGHGSPIFSSIRGYMPQALATLNAFVNASADPKIQNVSGLVGVNTPDGVQLLMSPGGVLDATFAKTVLDGLAGTPVLASNHTEAQLANAAEACNYNADKIATVGVCRTAGAGLGALYLQRNVPGAKVITR